MNEKMSIIIDLFRFKHDFLELMFAFFEYKLNVSLFFFVLKNKV